MDEAAAELAERRDRIAADMRRDNIDRLFAFHDGGHFIEKPNPVTILTGYKALGASMAVLDRDGSATLIVSPAWDAERAAAEVPGMTVTGSDELRAALADFLRRHACDPTRVGLVGLPKMAWRFGDDVRALFDNRARDVDAVLYAHARRKTKDELANAREAVRIAELAHLHLLETARLGRREDAIAAELRCFTKSLGAEDNFLLLCAGQHNRAVQPSSGHALEPGDIILAEITPSYRGQMAQICRTAVMGEPSPVLDTKYKLVVHAMEQGIAAAKPGAAMSEVCLAINRVLEAEGYGEYCHPPHIRRRGHGLGFASVLPGDVAPDNAIILEPDMFFVIHPNQYLPETGYLLCGEPTQITPTGSLPLTASRAALRAIAI